MNASEIRDAWGCIYSVDDTLPKFYLTDYKGTFWVNRNGELYQQNSGSFVEQVINHKLFKIKQFQEKEDIKITIEPRGGQKQIMVDGVTLDYPMIVQDGRCEIQMEEHNIHLIFEAFCDLTSQGNLKDIGENYRIISLLGRGGFATVYKGLAVKNEEFCAIKTARDAKVESELYREHELIAALRHDNVIRFIDFIIASRQFLVTELGTGGSLKHRIRFGDDIDEHLAKQIFQPLFSALAYCHDRDILHRDIKPDNIVLIYTGLNSCIPKLIDFGLSCLSSDAVEMKYIVGSYKFMSPEILVRKLFKQKNPYTGKVDVWGLGYSLFMALTRETPFLYDKDLLVYRKTLQKGSSNYVEMEAYQSLSSSTQTLIELCLAIPTRERASIDDLVDYIWEVPPSLKTYK